MLRRDDDSVLRIALHLKVSGKKKGGQPKKPGKASGRGDRKDWFEEGRCPESSKVEKQNASRRNGMNPAISAKGTTPDKN